MLIAQSMPIADQPHEVVCLKPLIQRSQCLRGQVAYLKTERQYLFYLVNFGLKTELIKFDIIYLDHD